MTPPNNDPTNFEDDDDDDDDGSGSEHEDEATKAAKRKERLEQNRVSARESRKRKKNMIGELQRTVITLSRENKDLNERNEALRRELVEIGTKNPGVVSDSLILNRFCRVFFFIEPHFFSCTFSDLFRILRLISKR